MDKNTGLICPMPCHTEECLHPALYVVRYRNTNNRPKSFMLCQNHKNTLDGIMDLLNRLTGHQIDLNIAELPKEEQCCE